MSEADKKKAAEILKGWQVEYEALPMAVTCDINAFEKFMQERLATALEEARRETWDKAIEVAKKQTMHSLDRWDMGVSGVIAALEAARESK